MKYDNQFRVCLCIDNIISMSFKTVDDLLDFTTLHYGADFSYALVRNYLLHRVYRKQGQLYKIIYRLRSHTAPFRAQTKKEALKEERDWELRLKKFSPKKKG